MPVVLLGAALSMVVLRWPTGHSLAYQRLVRMVTTDCHA